MQQGNEELLQKGNPLYNKNLIHKHEDYALKIKG